jgi:hypothetical protein
MTAAKSLLILLLSFAVNVDAARATCASGAPPAYGDIDRILLIRCQAVTNSYPCFRSLIVIQNGQIQAGYLNALNGVGLRGTYVFSSTTGDVGSQLQARLSDYKFFTMIVPSAGRYIDGEFNLLAVRRCGQSTIIMNDGDIDDAPHIPWSVLLQRLQAKILSLHWTQTSSNPDYKDTANWYKESAIPDMLEP